MNRTLIVVLASMSCFSAAVAADFKIIANPSLKVDSVSADELMRVFLSTTTSLGGSHVEPVLETGGATHEAFLKQFVGKSDSALVAYYRTLVFTGKASMPKQLASDADVAAYVAKAKGAIGYVSADAGTEGVKVLEVK